MMMSLEDFLKSHVLAADSRHDRLRNVLRHMTWDDTNDTSSCKATLLHAVVMLV